MRARSIPTKAMPLDSDSFQSSSPRDLVKTRQNLCRVRSQTLLVLPAMSVPPLFKCKNLIFESIYSAFRVQTTGHIQPAANNMTNVSMRE